MALYRNGLLAILLTAIICGCSGNSAPVVPEEVEYAPGTNADAHSITSRAGNHNLWLYSLIYIDASNPDEIGFEIVPVRETSIHWNVLSWLEQGPCTDCLKITGIGPSGSGTVLIDIEISHPFDNLHVTGFDFRGIAMFSGSHSFPESQLNTPDRSLGDGELVNADGYTTLYNFTTAGSGPEGMQGYIACKFATDMPPNALLNGYKRFISAGDENTRNAFYIGDAITVTHEIDMPDDEFIVGYAVDASWAPPINIPVDDPIADFGPEANCDEPWKIEVGGDPIGESGETELTIDVYDWQSPQSHHFPLLECPELFDGWITPDFEAFYEGYARFTATIQNSNSAPSGFYKCLVMVEDNANGQAPDWLDLTAYQVFHIEVGWYPGYPIDVTPPWLNFSPRDIYLEGNYAYIAGGLSGLHIFDISDPENPVWVNRVDTSGYASGVAVSGSYALVASSEGGHPYQCKLDIIDIDPPESAHIINTLNKWGYVRGLAVSGSSACFITRVQAGPDLHIIDIDPPESAYSVKLFCLPWASSGEVAASEGYAYVPTNLGFWIFDIDPPDSAYVVKEVDADVNGGIVVSGGYAYVADWSAGLQIFNIDPPESAYLVNSVDTPGTAKEVAVSGEYAYVTSQFQLHIIDIDPPESAYLFNSVNLAGNDVTAIAVSGGYAYVGDEYSGLQVIDIDPPESAYTVNLIDILSDARGVTVSEGYAYVAGDYGLQIIDYEPLESAYIVKSVHTPGDAQGVAVLGGYAYAADGDSGLQIIDIDPLESAYIVNTVDTPGEAQGVAVLGGYAYVADGESGLQIVDIYQPESAYVVNTVDTPGDARGVAVSGGYAYVADGGSGLQIVDIGVPESAYVVNTVDTPGTARGVVVSGGYAYVADGNSGLQIVDIGVPESAYIVKSVDTGSASGVAVSGAYAYVADGKQGLQIIDIDPLGSAYIVESIVTPSYARGVAVSDNYAYVAGYTFGLRIIKLW